MHQNDTRFSNAPRHAIVLIWGIASLMVLGGGAGICGAQEQGGSLEPVNLRPQWREGQTSRYEVSTQRVQRQSMQAGDRRREQQVTLQSDAEVTWHVRRVHADGGAECEMTIDWMQITARSEQGEQLNDSRRASGDTPPVHDMLRAMAGTPIEVRVAPDGSIQGISGTDAIRRQLEFEHMAPQDLDFIESASKLATLIGAPVAAGAGDQWQTRNRWRHELGFLHEQFEWELAGMERIAQIPVATVVGRGGLELEVDEADMPDEAPPIDVRLRDGDVNTQVMFDLQRGEVVGRNSVQNMLVEVVIRVPQQTVRQEIEQSVQSQVLRIAER